MLLTVLTISIILLGANSHADRLSTPYRNAGTGVLRVRYSFYVHVVSTDTSRSTSDWYAHARHELAHARTHAHNI